MNKLMTKIVGATLGLAMVVGAGVGVANNQKATGVYAVDNSTQYSLINSVDDLEAGKSYLITNGTSGTVKTMARTDNTNNRPTTDITISDSKITRGSSALSVTLGGESGAWTFHTDNYAGTAGYFGQGNQTSSNYLKIYSTVGSGDAGDTWTISFSDDAAVITSTKKTSRNVIRCNNSGTPISCYTSGQKAVYLWKEVAASSNPSLVFSDETINGEEGDEFSFTYSASNLTDDIVWSPASDATDKINYTVDTVNKAVNGTMLKAGSVTLTATSGSVSDSVTFNIAEHFINRKYTIASADSVDETGDVMTDATATFSTTYTGNKDQLTGGNQMVLSITGMTKKVNINKLVFSMHSNASSGSGYVKISIDGRADEYLSGSSSGTSFANFGDSGTTVGNTYRDIVWDNLSYTAVSSIVITIHATENSIFCQWFDIFFTEEENNDIVTALTVSPDSWSGFDSDTISVSDFTVSVTKNASSGTDADYEFQGIGSGEGDNFVARVENFVSGHPTTADTRLQWKAKYPTTAGGSTFLYTYVSLTVTADGVSSVALSGNMNTTTYETGDSWDTTGLTVSATYISTNITNVTANSTLNFYSDSAMTNEVATPSSFGVGANRTLYIKATYLGVSNATAYSQTVTVNKVSVITFTSGTDTGSSSGQNADTLSKKGITIDFTSAYTSSGAYRIYSGATMTITSTVGAIAKIELNMNGTYHSDLLSADVGTYNHSTTNKGIWTGDNTTIVFEASAQARVNSIVITLKPSAVESFAQLKTQASLSYHYSKDEGGNYTYSNVGMRFGALLEKDLWDEMEASTNPIVGYGVLLTTDAWVSTDDDVSVAYDMDSMTDEITAYYMPEEDKAAPSLATESQKSNAGVSGDYYIWNLFLNIADTDLDTVYVGVAYIKLANGDVVFMKKTSFSVKTLAADYLANRNCDDQTAGGSLANLAA